MTEDERKQAVAAGLIYEETGHTAAYWKAKTQEEANRAKREMQERIYHQGRADALTELLDTFVERLAETIGGGEA